MPRAIGVWRTKFRPIIAEIIRTVGTSDMKRLNKALRDAWDWGPRQHHPYVMWRKEIRAQLGLTKPHTRSTGTIVRTHDPAPHPNQKELFNDRL